MDEIIRGTFDEAPIGCAVIQREASESGMTGVSWMLRTPYDRLDMLGKTPEVEFRVGVFEELIEGVKAAPVIVILRLGQQAPMDLHLAWIDAFAEGALEDLAYQPQIALHLHDEDGLLVRSLSVPNILRPFAQRALGYISGFDGWKSEAFRTAVDRIQLRHPTVEQLWSILGKA